MNRWCLTTVLLLFFFSSGRVSIGAESTATPSATPVTHSDARKVEVRTLGPVPETGDLNLAITVTDASGKKVDIDQVVLLASMPAMGTMPYMESPGEVEKKGTGDYRGVVELTMGGSWDVTLTLTKEGRNAIYRYSVTGGVPGIVDKNRVSSADGAFDPNLIILDPQRIQRLGIRFADVKRAQLVRTVRSVGVVEADSSRRADVTVRFSGYLRSLERVRVGDVVKAGQVLAHIDSPELAAAQEEFVLATKISGSLHTSLPQAEERLLNLGMAKRDIARLARSEESISVLPIRAPINGTILESGAREGQQVVPGQVLYVVGDLQKIDVIAKIFQKDISDISVGSEVDLLFSGSAKKVRGRVTLVAPSVSLGSGTVDVRIRPLDFLPAMRPGVYVEAFFSVRYPEAFLIPSEAVLYSGLHRYVFVAGNGGAVFPQEVMTGRSADGLVEIVQGLSPNDKVVASGTFLLGSEANLRSALPKWRDVGDTP